MNQITKILSAAAFSCTVFLCAPCSGADAAPAPVKAEPAKAAQKVCVCIMDFTMPDIIGQNRFLNSAHKPVKVDYACSLRNADRVSINSVMQGYVGMIDARDHSATNDVNRALQVDDNVYNRKKDLTLYMTITHGEARPMLLGADYLAGYLGRHPDVFTTIPQPLIIAAMNKLQTEPDFPQDFMLRLAQETGATHLIYGSIADVRTKLKAFKGYNIETKSIVYDLDVIIKIVDLPAQKTVFSGIYTGVLQEQDLSTGGIELDGNRYQTLMKGALEQAAEDLYSKFLPGENQQLKVTPIPPKTQKKAPAAAVAPAPVQKAPAPVQAQVQAPAPEPDLPDSAVQKRQDPVIIRQSNAVVIGKDGLPVAPVPPTVTPVASDSGTVILNTNDRNNRSSVIVIDQQKQTKQAPNAGGKK